MRRCRAKLFYCWALLGSVVVSCKAATTPDVETLLFSASTMIEVVEPTRFTTTLSVTNTAATDTTYSAFCSPEFRLLSVSDSTGSPIWTSASRGLECGGSSSITLRPGQATRESLTATAQEVLGTSYPDGEYRMEVVALVAGMKRTLNAGRVLLKK
jgi:hypothetical protein